MNNQRSFSRLRIAALTLGTLALGACDRSPTAPADPGRGAGGLHFNLISGGGVEGAVCTELAAPIVVQARRDGKPAKAQLVNFVVTGGGGHVYAGAALTDNNGYARDYWTYGAAGPQALAVRAVDPATGAKLEFATATGTAVARPAALATPVFSSAEYSGDPLFAWLFASTTVYDACGDPVAGVRVTLRADYGPGHWASNYADTGADGKVTIRLALLEGTTYPVQVWVDSDPTVRYDGTFQLPAY